MDNLKDFQWQLGDLARIKQKDKPMLHLLLDVPGMIWVTETGDCVHQAQEADFICRTPLRYRYTDWKEVLIDFQLDFFTPYFAYATA